MSALFSHRMMMVFGTRPEAIKMAPLAHELTKHGDIALSICSTGQHQSMLQQTLNAFDLKTDEDFAAMSPGQNLNQLSHKIMRKLDASFSKFSPDLVLVHGDTTTCCIATLSAFQRKIPVAHIEAGLRSGKLDSPWPEEANRRLTDTLATLHFSPTEDAKKNLLNEGIPPKHIKVTGNTVIDALHWMRHKQEKMCWRPAESSVLNVLTKNQRIVLITCHRRENLGRPLTNICQAIFELAEIYPKVQFVYPVHLNPEVQKTVQQLLSNKINIHLIPPQNYEDFVWLMSNSYFIISDSGGIQEEAPAIGKPVLVLRNETERPEALETGAVQLIGTNSRNIVEKSQQLLEDEKTYRQMSRIHMPYGDGYASQQIVTHLRQWLTEQRHR